MSWALAITLWTLAAVVFVWLWAPNTDNSDLDVKD